MDYQDGWETESGWPDDPRKDATGYNELKIQTSPSSHANFESILVITAELIKRLEATGKDGRLLLFESRCKDNYNEFSQDARNALNYVAGWSRKHLSYQAWLKQRKYRRKQDVV
jgi:hypothetical protein